jgi:hypothetical protein
VIHDVPTNAWDLELEELFLQTGACFARVEARRRMRDYVRGLLGPVGRKNSWQFAEYAGHATPHGLQHPLSHSRWDADGLRDASASRALMPSAGPYLSASSSVSAGEHHTGRASPKPFSRSTRACQAAEGISPSAWAP